MDADELDVRPILDSLRRHWAIVLLLALAGTVSALVVTRLFLQPVYRSTARVLIESGQPPIPAAAGTILPAADTYVELVRGDWLRREVARRLGFAPSDRPPFDLAASSVRGTQMVVLNAESPDPKLAADAASTTLAVLQEVVRQRQSERFAAAEQRLDSQIKELTDELNRARSALAQARSETERSSLSDQVARLQAALAQLQASYGNLKLAQAQSGDVITVLEPPAVPERPVRPNPMLNSAVGGTLGLLLGAGYAAAAALLDRRFRSIKEVEQTLGLPVLSVIYRGEPGSEGGGAAVGEGFRLLRINIRFAAVDRPLRVFAVASVEPQAGKTTVALGLAQALTALGDRVLVVDADLRRAGLHGRLEVGRSPGLSDWLVNPDLDMDRVLRRIDGGPWLMPAGTPAPNPGDLVGSRRFGELIRSLAQEFDAVVVDTAPAAAGADLFNVAAAADGLILVVSLSSTDREEVVRVVNQLKAEGVRVVGVVVNRVERRGRGYYAYYRYGEDGHGPKLRLGGPWARREQPPTAPGTGLSPGRRMRERDPAISTLSLSQRQPFLNSRPLY